MLGGEKRRSPRRRSDGERSRNAILGEAARLATVEGIGGLSIGRLADAVGMSKSGLFAHFGSKEELQLATIETASALFAEQVMEPAAAAPNGLERLRELAELFLRQQQEQPQASGAGAR
jgi:AcrR family transcriptional regulator